MAEEIDLVGKKFGKLLVIGIEHKKDKNGKKTRRYQKCLCDCGKMTLVLMENLKNGKSKTCGECPKYIDISGQKFGRVLALSFNSIDRNGDSSWNCICDCGKSFVTIAYSLRSGATKSCGCLNVEKVKEALTLKNGEASINRIYGYYKRNAEKRGLSFEISKDIFADMIIKNCHYCDCGPSNVNKNFASGIFLYNGIDRIDNSVGYIEGNVVTCCGKCNHSKFNYSYEEFLYLVKNIYENLKLNELEALEKII